MKRFLLLGIAILCLGSMAMAADVIIDADGTLSGDYTGDYIHIGVNANANVSLDGDLTVDHLTVTDTTVGAMGSLTVGASYTANVTGNVMVGMGSMGVLNIEGTMNVGSYFNYDGNPTLSGMPGVYALINVSGDALLQGGAQMSLGGWAANYPVDVNISGNAVVEGGLKPIYAGGVLGGGTVTMSGNAKLQNTSGDTGYYDNVLNVGWNTAGTEGKLIVESGNTVQFRHYFMRGAGTTEYILDASGQACVLTAKLQDGEPVGEGINVDCYVRFYLGHTIDLNTVGVDPGVLVEGFAVNIAKSDNANWILYEGGSYGAVLLVDGAANWMWRLRKVTDETGAYLQAYIIPEPTTLALLGLGGLLAALRRRS
jgi:hypothetical protein